MANKTIKQSIEDLFIGLGGNPSALTDNTDTSDVIDDLESAIKGCVGGVIDDTASSSTKTYSSSKIESLIPADELPAVTSDDNGKVLAVVDGAWNKASASGGASFFVITATDNNGTVTIDKTYSEIEQAYKANTTLFVDYDDGTIVRRHIPLNECTLSGSNLVFDFVLIMVSDGVTTTGDIQIDCDHEVTHYFYNEVS